MANPGISPELQRTCVEAYAEAIGNGARPFRMPGEAPSALERAAKALTDRDAGGLSLNTWRTRVTRSINNLPDAERESIEGGYAAEQPTPGLKFPDIPSEDMPIDGLIDYLENRFRKEKQNADAKKWRRIQVQDRGPFGVAWLGDPHVDNHGCNWPLLRRDVGIIKNTPGLYAANAGDTVDNWTGRLLKLKGSNPVTDHEAWRLAKWLIDELSGHWLLFVLGNHDLWDEGGRILRSITKNVIDCDDWQAQVVLVTPGGMEFPVWLAHSFKGSSIWNPAHGPMRMAKLSGRACLYIQGHHHEWTLHQEEDAEKGVTFWAAKARGYKWNDHYAAVHGFPEQQEGAAIVSIFNPDSRTAAGAVQCFADIEAGADYLTWLRSRA